MWYRVRCIRMWRIFFVAQRTRDLSPFDTKTKIILVFCLYWIFTQNLCSVGLIQGSRAYIPGTFTFALVSRCGEVYLFVLACHLPYRLRREVNSSYLFPSRSQHTLNFVIQHVRYEESNKKIKPRKSA